MANNSDMKIAELDKKLAVLETTVNDKFSSFEEKLNNFEKSVSHLSEVVSQTSKNNEVFLTDVKDFIASLVGNYVPVSQWTEHIKEDAVNEGKVVALHTRLDQVEAKAKEVSNIDNRLKSIEDEMKTTRAIKGVYLKGWSSFLYPVLMIIITIVTTFVLNKFLGI